MSDQALSSAPLRLVVVCPHFWPDTAPTGTVITRIVDELAARGHEIHVVTSLPWYRTHSVEPGWAKRGPHRYWQHRRERWGSITRLDPFASADKRNLVRRALGFAGFSMLATVAAARAGGWLRRVDAVIAMSPPLTLGLAGRIAAWSHRAPLVFNIQDVFPDAAVLTGAITNSKVIAAASWLERWSYRVADAVTVLSDDLAANVSAKLPARQRHKVAVIPNFVDVERIRPADRMTEYRRELGIGPEPVVLYAGNIGFSQPLELMLVAARALPDVAFVINGEGSAKADLRERAGELPNVYFGGYVPEARLSELLATGDVHVVALRRGMAAASVPSKTYSILAAARPVLAAIDEGSAIARLVDGAGAGRSVPPEDEQVFVTALREMLADGPGRAVAGAAGRAWVVATASPTAVAAEYAALVARLRGPSARSPAR